MLDVVKKNLNKLVKSLSQQNTGGPRYLQKLRPENIPWKTMDSYVNVFFTKKGLVEQYWTQLMRNG